MNLRILLCLVVLGMAMARKGSNPTNCRNTDCRGLVGSVQTAGSLETTGGTETTNKNGGNRKNRKNRKNKKKNGNSEDDLSQNIQHNSSPSLHEESSSSDRDGRLINLGSLFGNSPTSTFSGRPTSSVFGGRPTINRPVSPFGNSHHHGNGFGGSLSTGSGPGLSIGVGPTHGSSFGSHGSSVGSHGSSLGSHGSSLGSHGSSFGSHGSSLGSHGSSFGSHGSFVGSHGSSLGSHGSSLGSHGSSFGSSFSSTSGCRFWCKTPQGQYYCCENSNQASSGVSSFVKPGQCPPVRPSCPPTRSFRPPSQCSSDARCPGSEKCCFDTCLQHHTCKPPQGGLFGR